MKDTVSILEQGPQGIGSIGNDDISIVCARKYEMVRMTAYVDFVMFIVQSVILRYSFTLRVTSDILWSSCFESYGPKDTC